jgi:hypothetical protein
MGAIRDPLRSLSAVNAEERAATVAVPASAPSSPLAFPTM